MKAIAAGGPALMVAAMLAFLARGQGGAASAAEGAPSSEPEVLLVPLDAGAPPAGYPPDPAPLVTRHQWLLKLAYRSGQLVFRGARPLELSQPTATARAFGRFALELYVGKELVDRVRFDFPLLADELSSAPSGAPRRGVAPDSPLLFGPKLSTQASIALPDSQRATRAVLVDRATGTIWPLPWPLAGRIDGGLDRR
jgi:hypothetical protein